MRPFYTVDYPNLEFIPPKICIKPMASSIAPHLIQNICHLVYFTTCARNYDTSKYEN